MTLTEHEKEQIIQLYYQGYNTVQIGKMLVRSDSTIRRYLKKCNLKSIGTKRLLTQEDEQEVCKLYLSGLTSAEIYERYYKDKVGCQETIQKIIREHGIARKRGYQNLINHDYFENIDTPEKA